MNSNWDINCNNAFNLELIFWTISRMYLFDLLYILISINCSSMLHIWSLDPESRIHWNTTCCVVVIVEATKFINRKECHLILLFVADYFINRAREFPLLKQLLTFSNCKFWNILFSLTLSPVKPGHHCWGKINGKSLFSGRARISPDYCS